MNYSEIEKKLENKFNTKIIISSNSSGKTIIFYDGRHIAPIGKDLFEEELYSLIPVNFEFDVFDTRMFNNQDYLPEQFKPSFIPSAAIDMKKYYIINFILFGLGFLLGVVFMHL